MLSRDKIVKVQRVIGEEPVPWNRRSHIAPYRLLDRGLLNESVIVCPGERAGLSPTRVRKQQ